MKALLALAALLSTLTGCAVYTPSGAVIVDPTSRHDAGDRDRDRKFCPPGQAKKGNC